MRTSLPTGLTRRELLRLGLVAAGAGVLGGCAPRSGGEGTVSWEAIPSYSLQTTDPNRAEYLTTQLRTWQEGAGTRIDPRVTSADTAAAMAKLLLQASQGRASDVAQVDGYIFGRLASYASVLDDQMAAAGLRLDDWFPALQDVMTGGTDTVRALQFTTDVRVLYYRKDVVAEPPATWDEVMSLASSLPDDAAVSFPAGRGEGAVTTTLWPLFWGQGVELFDESGRVAFQSGAGYDAMRQALAVVADAVGSVAPPRVATFATEDDQISDVVAGRVAMFLGGNWQAAALDNALPDQSFFDNWDVAPLPTIGGDQPVTSAGGWVWAAFTDDQEDLDAGTDWVIDAYVSDAGMASWCSIGGYLPPRQSVYDLPEYKQNAFTPTFREHLANFARPRPGARDYLQTSDSLQIALSSVAAGTASPDQALDEALNRIV